MNGSNDNFLPSEEEGFNHLAELCALECLNEIDLSGSDFFSHSIFQYLDVRGDQISDLALHDIDEMNLNAVILIGDRCPSLKSFAILQCHFQIEIEDSAAVERIVNERSKQNNDISKSFSNSSKTNTNFIISELPLLFFEIYNFYSMQIISRIYF